MAVVIGSARHDENYDFYNGAIGDQLQGTGDDWKGEVAFENFYVHNLGWIILRAKSDSHADSLATSMKRACNNKNIGYSMGSTVATGRYGVVQYGTATTRKCNADCSALVRQCVKEACGKDPGDFATSTEVNILMATGLFDKIVYTSSVTLYTGDILVTKSSGHTAIVTSGAARSSGPKQVPGNAVNNANIWYRSHSQDIGWNEAVRDGQTSGVTGASKRIEAFKLDFSKANIKIDNVKLHIQGIGWKTFTNPTSDTVLGTIGEAKRVEALEINCSNIPAGKKLMYRVHVQNMGWKDWVENTYTCGTIGQGLRIEAIQIKLV